MPDEQPGIQSSRPTFAVDGTESSSLTGGLLRLRVRDDVRGLSNCEAEFGNWGPKGDASDFLFFDRSVLDFGKELKVKLGTTAIFTGKVTGLEARYPNGNTPSLVVLAEDRFQDLRMTRRTRTFADVSDSDVFSQIAGDHGLSPSVGVSGPTHKVLAQVNQSDLAFMRERARAIDAELWMEGNNLHAQSHSGRNAGRLQLTYGGDLREFCVVADLAGQRSSVTVNGWDVSSKQGVKHEADDSVIRSELNGDSSGASVLTAALGKRKEALVHTVPLNSRDAQARAEAHFRMTARRFVTGHGIAEASSKVRVGSTLDLRGLGPLFSGKYYVSE